MNPGINTNPRKISKSRVPKQRTQISNSLETKNPINTLAFITLHRKTMCLDLLQKGQIYTCGPAELLKAPLINLSHQCSPLSNLSRAWNSDFKNVLPLASFTAQFLSRTSLPIALLFVLSNYIVFYFNMNSKSPIKLCSHSCLSYCLMMWS